MTFDAEVRVGADVEDAESKVKHLGDTIDSSLTGATKSFQNAQGGLNASLQSLQDKIKSQTVQMSQSSAVMRSAGNDTSRLTEEQQKLDYAITRLRSSIDPAFAATMRLGSANDLLFEGLRKGIITQKEYDSALQMVATKLGQVTNEAGKAGHANAGVTREIIVLGHEAVSGNFSRMPGSLMVLASRAGMGITALGGLVAAGLAAVGILGYLGFKAEENERTLQALNRQFTATGDGTFVLKGGVKSLVDELSKLPDISRKAAEEMVASFAHTPQIGENLRRDLLLLAPDIAAAYGVEIPKAAEKLAEGFKTAGAGAKTFGEYLTAEQIIHIENLEKTNKKIEAQQYLLEILQAKFKGLSDQGLTPLQKATRDLTTAWEGMTSSIGSSSALTAVRDLMAEIVKSMTYAINHAGEFAKALAPSLPGGISQVLFGVDLFNKMGEGRPKPATAAPKPAPSTSTSEVSEQDKQAAKDALALADNYKSVARQISELRTQEQTLVDQQKKVNTSTKEGAELYARLGDGITGIEKKIADLRKRQEPKGQDARFQEMKNSIQQEKEQEGSYFKDSIAMETAFWEQKLSLVGTKTKQDLALRRQIQTEIYNLHKQAAQQELQLGAEAIQHAEKIGNLQIINERQTLQTKRQLQQISADDYYAGELDLANREHAVRIKALQDKSALYTHDKIQRQKVLDEIAELEAAHQNKVNGIYHDAIKEQAKIDRSLAEEHIAHIEQMASEEIALKKEVLQEKKNQDLITNAQYLQQMVELENQEYAIKLQALNDRIKLYETDLVARQRILDQIEILERKHAVNVEKIHATLAKDQNKIWESLSNQFSNLWNQGVQAMMNGTLTWRNAFRAIASQLTQWFLTEVVFKKVKAWVLGERTETAATQEGVAARLGARALEAAQSVMQSAGAVVKSIMNYAAEAFAGVWSALSGIPFVGPAMAAAAAPAAFGTVAAMAGNVMFAEKGFDIPAGMNPLIQGHQREMVLPASIADPMRDMIANGGSLGGGGLSVHIHATDAQSVKRLILNNKSAVADALKAAVRDLKK